MFTADCSLHTKKATHAAAVRDGEQYRERNEALERVPVSVTLAEEGKRGAVESRGKCGAVAAGDGGHRACTTECPTPIGRSEDGVREGRDGSGVHRALIEPRSRRSSSSGVTGAARVVNSCVPCRRLERSRRLVQPALEQTR